MTATIAEIIQQPDVWQEVVALLQAQGPAVQQFLQPTAADRRIVLTGAGSSAYAGELLAPALTAGLAQRVDAIATTDLVASPLQELAEQVPTLLVSFARSGNSPESQAATRLADRQLDNLRHLVITCNVGGQLAVEHASRPDSLVLAMPPRTNDRGFAMTSSFTSMALAGWMALSGSGRRRTDAVDRPVEESVARLASAAQDVIDSRHRLQAIASRDYERIVYLGSGPLRAVARESALKLLELSAGRLTSLYDTPLGFRHGPKSVLTAKTLVIVFVSNDPYTRKYDEDIVAEVRAAIGEQNVLVISGERGAEGSGRWSLPQLDRVDDVLIALPYLVVSQILAHETALRVGLDPDNPFPGGEVNRVVQGVTVHPLAR